MLFFPDGISFHLARGGPESERLVSSPRYPGNKSLCSCIDFQTFIRAVKHFASFLVCRDGPRHRNNTPKTRQDNNSTQSKVTRIAFDNCKKGAHRSWRLTALSATRHSAVQRWLRVVRMSWYHWYPGQHLGTSDWTPVRVRWVPTYIQLIQDTCSL